MCEPTSIVLGGIALASAIYGGVSTKYYKDKEIGAQNKAEAEKEKLINLAQGRAEALRIEKEAEAAGIKLVKEAGADSAVLSLKAMEALTKVADGKATKIIVPSEIQNLSGVLSAAKAVVEKDEKAE